MWPKAEYTGFNHSENPDICCGVFLYGAMHLKNDHRFMISVFNRIIGRWVTTSKVSNNV